MIVAALGYTAESLPGTWPGAFVNKAQGLGILDTCKTTGNAAAPRQDIACFLYDALTSPIGYVDKDGAWHANVGVDDGIDNFDTMIKRLGAVPYLNGAKFVVTGEENSDINLQNYLGAYVTAYASKDDDTEIIAIKEVLSEFIEGTYKDGKVNGYTISDDTAVVDTFKNGDAIADSALSAHVKENVKLAVKLNGKKVSEIYSIQIWEAEETFMAAKDVQEEISEDNKLEGYPFALDDDDAINTKTFSIEGKTAITDIAKDDVVTVYLHQKDASDGAYKTGDIVKIEVSDKTVEGSITKISKDGEPTIAGTTYGLNEDNKDDAYAVGDEGTFFIDYAGDIFHFEAVDDTSSNYGVVLEIGSTAGKYGADTNYAKMLLADGTTKEFELKNADVLKTFKTTDKDTATGEVFAKGSTYGKLVKYTVNAKDQITKFVISETRITDADGEFNAKGVYVKEGALLKNNAVVFSYTGLTEDDIKGEIKAEDVNADKADADKYEVVTATSMYDADFTGITPFLNDDADYAAAIIEGAKAGEDEYAIFLDYTADGDGITIWEALYDGKYYDGDKTEFKVDEDLGTSFTTGAAAYYIVKVDESGVASKVTKGTKTIESADVTDATSVTNGVLKDAAGKNWTLSDELVVYVEDADGNWSVGKESAMTARKDKLASISLVDADADGEYDIAIVVKK